MRPVASRQAEPHEFPPRLFRVAAKLIGKPTDFEIKDSPFGRGQEPRACMALAENGPEIVLRDANGKASAILRVSAEGPSLRLKNAKTGEGLEQIALEDGPSVYLFDANKKPRVIFTMLEHGGGLALYGPDGKTRLTLDVTESGDSSLTMKDASGKVFWSAP